MYEFDSLKMKTSITTVRREIFYSTMRVRCPGKIDRACWRGRLGPEIPVYTRNDDNVRRSNRHRCSVRVRIEHRRACMPVAISPAVFREYDPEFMDAGPQPNFYFTRLYYSHFRAIRTRQELDRKKIPIDKNSSIPWCGLRTDYTPRGILLLQYHCTRVSTVYNYIINTSILEY